MLGLLAVFALAAAPAEGARKQNGRIAFVSFRDGDPEVYRMERDGKQPVRLTNNVGPSPDLPALDFWPSWSSDGAKIAFTSFRGMNPDIYTMNGDGSGKTRVSPSTQPATSILPSHPTAGRSSS